LLEVTALVSAIVQRVARQIRILPFRINDIVVEKIAIIVLVTVELRPGTSGPSLQETSVRPGGKTKTV
jgi:hypothetical protein